MWSLQCYDYKEREPVCCYEVEQIKGLLEDTTTEYVQICLHLINTDVMSINNTVMTLSGYLH